MGTARKSANRSPEHSGLPSPQALAEHLQALEMPDDGIAYVLETMSQPPSRRVGEHRLRNFVLDVPMPQFGVRLQAESATGEYYFLLELSRQDDVWAVFDQPPPVFFNVTTRRGYQTPSQHTPDYLVVRNHVVVAYEVKATSMLDELCESRKCDWQKSPSGYRFLPARDYFERLGIAHEIHPAEAVPAIRAQNYQLLNAVRDLSKPIDARTADRLLQQVSLRTCVSGREVQVLLGTVDLTIAYALVQQKILFVDLDNALLADPDAVWFATQPGVAEEVTRAQKTIGAALERYGTSVSIRDVCAPRDELELLVRLSNVDPSHRPPDVLSLRRSERSRRRYRAILRKAGGDPRSLIPKQRPGNRSPRKSAEHYELINDVIHNALRNPSRPSTAIAFLEYHRRLHESSLCQRPLSRTAFYLHAKKHSPTATAASRGGRREANALSAPISPQHHGLLWTRAFAGAHIDHYQIDNHLILGEIDGKKVKRRPWLTAMVDAYTKETLGIWLSFRPPSRVACAMVIRDCVRRHERLPEMLVVDGGSEFDSVHFSATLATLGIVRTNRPPEDPRFGTEAERLFLTLKEKYGRGQAGFTEGIARHRRISGTHAPARFAALTLSTFARRLEAFLFTRHDSIPRRGMDASPSALRCESLEQIPFSGRPAAWDLPFLILTPVEAPRDQYAIDPIRGVRVFDLWYASEVLARQPRYKRQVQVRIDPCTDAAIYVCIDDHWHVFLRRESRQLLAKEYWSAQSIASTRHGLSGDLRAMAESADRAAYLLLCSEQAAEASNTRSAQEKPSSVPAPASDDCPPSVKKPWPSPGGDLASDEPL
ncbi:integrase catalytic domain-containing protein [Novilysobacter erysipheiresistens]|uniref:DDE-type integrase/transposase/recombinase n=1 Tax=Novilysobacter erysipheiresistens TaxID=1749332 RepID=A0ABU7YXC1_9GAMM